MLEHRVGLSWDEDTEWVSNGHLKVLTLNIAKTLIEDEKLRGAGGVKRGGGGCGTLQVKTIYTKPL